MANTEKNVSPSRKSGVKFSEKIFAVRKRVREGRKTRGRKKIWVYCAFLNESILIFQLNNVFFCNKVCTGLERVPYGDN